MPEDGKVIGTSHGMCEECAKAVNAELDRREADAIRDEAGRYLAPLPEVLPARPAGPWDQNEGLRH